MSVRIDFDAAGATGATGATGAVIIGAGGVVAGLSARGIVAGPDGTGHLGDLPKLVVTADGKISVVAPHLKLADVKSRALVIHEGGDNYSDTPELGGGGKRIACGVIE